MEEQAGYGGRERDWRWRRSRGPARPRKRGGRACGPGVESWRVLAERGRAKGAAEESRAAE
jgi:hypothetical protein